MACMFDEDKYEAGYGGRNRIGSRRRWHEHYAWQQIVTVSIVLGTLLLGCQFCKEMLSPMAAIPRSEKNQKQPDGFTVPPQHRKDKHASFPPAQACR